MVGFLALVEYVAYMVEYVAYMQVNRRTFK